MFSLISLSTYLEFCALFEVVAGCERLALLLFITLESALFTLVPAAAVVVFGGIMLCICGATLFLIVWRPWLLDLDCEWE